MKLCVYIVVFGIYAISSAWCKKPTIRTIKTDFLPYKGGELVVEAGKGFTLRCVAPMHVNWTSYPTYEDEGSMFNNSGGYSNGSYVANFQVIKSNYRDTGYYYCSTDDANGIDDANNAAKVYIYVKDDENILIFEDHALFETVIQYSTYVIPCRPSSPDVQMSLAVDGERIDDVGHLREFGDNLKVSFDPKIGYTLENINLKDSGTYSCIANRSGLEDERNLIIQVLPFTDTMPSPFINGTSERLFGVEGTKVTLECSVVISEEVVFSMSWTVPHPNDINSTKITVHNTTNFGTISTGNNPMKNVVRLLTINNATMNDSGIYKCEVKDHNNNYNVAEKYLHISGSNDKYINITTDSEVITVVSKTQVQWVIKLASHPPAVLSWISPTGKNLSALAGPAGLARLKYEKVSERAGEIILRIFNVTLNDAGVYQLKANNTQLEKILALKLIVEEGPKVILAAEGPNYYVKDKTCELHCDVTGYPKPSITWKQSFCENPPNCTITKTNIKRTPSETILPHRSSSYRSTLLLTADRSRYIWCAAKNEFGSVEQRMTFWVSDVGETGSEVKVTAPFGAGPEDIVAQDNVTLECGFSKYNYTDSLVWSFRPDKNSAKMTYNISDPQTTNFSFKKSLIIHNITEDYSGEYTCTANDTHGIPATKKMYFFVQAQEAPSILSENMNDTEQTVKEGAQTTLTCNVKGLPKPTITWLKDGEPLILIQDNITLYTLRDQNTSLDISYSPSKIEGQYTCDVRNRAGTKQKTTLIKIDKQPPSSAPKLILGAFLVLVLISICVIAYLVIKIRKEKKLREELKAIGLEQFDKGAMDNINPDLPIDDQAELLPYDRKWEFPREKLKLGKQLGAGAFGVVMKAEAVGISEGEAISMVAVKMVKRNADHTYIKALASELKIMVHLGKHLNVVNLLGACTKNLNKRELLVIVEYCRFGNLHNYLLRHRADFIDQVDQLTGIIDPNFGAEIIARHDSMVMKSRMKYAGLSFSRSRSDSESSGCSPSNSGTLNSDAALISMTPTGGEEGCMLSNNSTQQPEWRSNYRGDYKGHVRPICTRDVLCWAFQVARGMDYLAGRKVLHGDLAARNILLADDNVVKICDFGLAKSMYKTDNYKKKGDGPLPIKWMAVESISDRVFSTQSDVWSYGIVLWEFFSLAKTPYPGMEADEKLYQKLIGGYRMDKPEYATNAIYEVMKNCWLPKPVDRPTFEDLSETLGSMLEDSVKTHYMDLNDPYMNMNDIQWKAGQQSDYLAMMTAPTYDNMVAPGAECNEEELHQYVNGGIPSSPLALGPDQGEASGYLCMSPALKEAAIFSPRATETNDLFSFSPKPGLSRDESGNPFEKSRLLSTENNYLTPKSPTAVNNLNKEATNIKPQGWEQNSNFMPSFSNPSYQVLGAAIAPTTDNYINMPQHKQASMDETDDSAFSNYVPMAKPSIGAFNQMAFTKSKDGEGFVHFPNSDSSKVDSGIEMQREENPYVN